MRFSIAAALAVFIPVVLPQSALAAGCSGEACGSLAYSADGCAWTNSGDKAVRVAVNGGSGGPLVTILAPGEQFKAPRELCASARYEASFPALKVMPGEVPAPAKVAVALPKAKPAVPVAAPVAVPEAVAVAAVAAAPVAMPAVFVPRAKPAAPPVYPPMPRLKPAAPAEAVAEAPAASVASAGGAPLAACSENCPPIVFKMFDECLWVLNLNPRPVVFEADLAGKRATIMLEAADGVKADKGAAATQAKDGGALHLRIGDPFQSSGSGIPAFRARLGAPGACVKNRGEITKFAAHYAK